MNECGISLKLIVKDDTVRSGYKCLGLRIVHHILQLDQCALVGRSDSANCRVDRNDICIGDGEIALIESCYLSVALIDRKVAIDCSGEQVAVCESVVLGVHQEAISFPVSQEGIAAIDKYYLLTVELNGHRSAGCSGISL